MQVWHMRRDELYRAKHALFSYLNQILKSIQRIRTGQLVVPSVFTYYKFI